jgi:hypothetical protein
MLTAAAPIWTDQLRKVSVIRMLPFSHLADVWRINLHHCTRLRSSHQHRLERLKQRSRAPVELDGQEIAELSHSPA